MTERRFKKGQHSSSRTFNFPPPSVIRSISLPLIVNHMSVSKQLTLILNSVKFSSYTVGKNLERTSEISMKVAKLIQPFYQSTVQYTSNVFI